MSTKQKSHVAGDDVAAKTSTAQRETKAAPTLDERLDDELDDSFPASDPPSVTREASPGAPARGATRKRS